MSMAFRFGQRLNPYQGVRSLYPASVPTYVPARNANLKAVKIRLETVKVIKKITNSMKMVASARLQLAEKDRIATSQYYNAAKKLFDGLPEPEVKNQVIVLVTPDRGLCGAVPSSVVRTGVELAENVPKGANVSFVCVGTKSEQVILAGQFKDNLVMSFNDVFRRPLTYPECAFIAERVLRLEFDKLTLVYTQYNSISSFEPVCLDFVSTPTLLEMESTWDKYEFDEAEQEVVLESLNAFNFTGALWSGIYDSRTAEEASRMMSMDGATKNGNEQIRKLTILYNKTRQASITTELTEIIGGMAGLGLV